MKHSTPRRGESHRGTTGAWSTRDHRRVPAVIVLALAVLSAVLVASGASAAQADTPGTTVPVTETTAAPTATEPTVTEPTTTPPATAAPVPEGQGLAAATSVPCEGWWKNNWFGNNSITGTVTIGDKAKAVAERTVTFVVTSTSTETCTAYAQIFTYDGAGDWPQTAVATTPIVLMPGESKTVELKTSECRIQADITLKAYETLQWPGMNWDDYITGDTSTCPPPPPCQTSNGTAVQPGYAVPDGDHVLVRTKSTGPDKVAYVVYELAGTKAPANNDDLTNVMLTLVQGMNLVGQPVMGTTDNCTPVPVPECKAYAVVEIDASTTPLPRIFLSVSPKALEILGKTGLDLTKLLDIKNIDINAVMTAFAKLSPDDQTALITELLKQPGLTMPFYAVNWFSVEECPPDPVPTTTTTPPSVAPAQEAAVLAATDTPTVAAAGALPATGSNTTSFVELALFLMFSGLALVGIARYRKVR